MFYVSFIFQIPFNVDSGLSIMNILGWIKDWNTKNRCPSTGDTESLDSTRRFSEFHGSPKVVGSGWNSLDGGTR